MEQHLHRRQSLSSPSLFINTLVKIFFSVAIFILILFSSEKSHAQCNVTFTNTGCQTADLFWNNNGVLSSYGQISANSSKSVTTYNSHVWVIKVGATTVGNYTINCLTPTVSFNAGGCQPAILRPKNRTITGVDNNPNNPSWGAAITPFFRELPAVYGPSDPKNALNGVNRPSPRQLSNQLMDEVEDAHSDRLMSGVAYVWGQFIDHDITLSKGGTESAPISLPSYEPIFTAPIPFTRSAAHPGTGVSNAREQTNLNTSWVDASMVYAYNDADARWLRTLVNGKLKTSAGNMLPFNTTTGEFDAPIDPNAPISADDNGKTKKTFVAGDRRVAENPNLTAFHTIFVREHNSICDRLKSQGWTNDEDMYQRARKEVGAIIQSITWNQWLPSFGIQLNSYSGYNVNARPDIRNTFTAAAYRWHTLVENDIILRDNACKGIGAVELPLKNVFFNIDIIRKYDAGVLLRGLAFHRQYETDIKVASGLRNFLFGQGSGLDLPSISLQRGRDHGLPDYNTVRKFYTGSGVTSFSSISSRPRLVSKLNTLYGNSTNDVDLFVGLFSEDRLPGKSVGVTLNAIAKKQFEDLRDGDYYYYLNDPAFTSSERTTITNTTLSQVIERNSNAGNFPANIFFKQPCDNDPQEDLSDQGTPVCQGNAITVFDNCTSTSGVSFTPGSYNQAALSARGIANDVISKINVTAGFAVILYENDNFTGRSAYYGSNTCLPTNWDNITSSMKVICLSNDPSTINCAGFAGAVYDKCYGSPFNLTVGSYTTEQLTSVGISDNMVSGVRVNNGFTITLYQNDNFQGQSLTFTGPTVVCLDLNLNYLFWSKSTSSIKVTCTSNPSINNCATKSVTGAVWDSESETTDDRYWGISMGLGDFNSARLSAMGLPSRSLSKLEVNNGFAFTLFDADNFTGNSKVFTGKTSSLGSWNNRAVSIRVTCLTPAAQLLAAEDALALEAKADANRSRLDWVTNLGEKADYFVIEKFNANTGDFEPIATVNSVKTSGSEFYTEYDENIQEGDNIYRIKVRLNDGSLKITEHKIVNFKFGVDINVFPNPASDVLRLDLNKYLDKNVEIYLYDYLGKQVAYQKIDKLNTSFVELDIAGKQEGNYVVRIKTNGKRDVTRKVVIMH